MRKCGAAFGHGTTDWHHASAMPPRMSAHTGARSQASKRNGVHRTHDCDQSDGKIVSAGVTLTGACEDAAHSWANTRDAAWGTDNGTYKCRLRIGAGPASPSAPAAAPALLLCGASQSASMIKPHVARHIEPYSRVFVRPSRVA
jgi:hypothetical protein